MFISVFGDEDVEILVDYFSNALERSSIDKQQIEHEWQKLKDMVYER